jgi:Prophage endopeptidase tail
MEPMYIEDLYGEQYFAQSVVDRARRVNGEKEISLSLFEEGWNKEYFSKIDHHWKIGFDGEEYVVMIPRSKPRGKKAMKELKAVHRFFIDMRDDWIYETYSGSMTFQARLNIVFGGSGYNFVIVDTFLAQDMENFGDSSRLDLFQKALTQYEAEFEVKGKIVYLRKQIGRDTDFHYRHQLNLKDIVIETDATNFSTYARGYGKLKEIQDTLSNESIPYKTRSGTYYTEPGQNKLATDTEGASFSFTFTGTGFSFTTLAHFLGGKWEFKIDEDKAKTISTYKDVVAEQQTYEIFRGLENKTYTVIVTFKGKDSNNPYTKGTNAKPHNYLLDGNIIHLYRALVGDEMYVCTAEYTSPLAAIPGIGIKHHPPVRDETYTKQESLYARIKKEVDESLSVSITIDIADLRKQGYEQAQPNEGDRIFVIDERLDLNIETRIVEIQEVFDVDGNLISLSVTLANKSIKESYQSQMSDAVKQLKNLFEGRAKIPYNVLDEAVKLATEALKKAQTELIFDNGIVAVSKNDPNLMVVLNSAGLGISTDGGVTFENAITAFGINTNLLTAGAINTNNIQIIGTESYFFWDGNEFLAMDPNDINKYVKITAGLIEVGGGAIRIKRPDGAYFIIDGIPQYDFTIQGMTPQFTSPEVTVAPRSCFTNATTSKDFQAYVFRHQGQYLRVNTSLYQSGGGTAYMSVEQSYEGFDGWKRWALVSSTVTSEDANSENSAREMLIDLGVPSSGIKLIYIRIWTSNANTTAYGRVTGIWQEG